MPFLPPNQQRQSTEGHKYAKIANSPGMKVDTYLTFLWKAEG